MNKAVSPKKTRKQVVPRTKVITGLEWINQKRIKKEKLDDKTKQKKSKRT